MVVRYVLDTDHISLLFRRDRLVSRRFEREVRSVGIAVISVQETFNEAIQTITNNFWLTFAGWNLSSKLKLYSDCHSGRSALLSWIFSCGGDNGIAHTRSESTGFLPDIYRISGRTDTVLRQETNHSILFGSVHQLNSIEADYDVSREIGDVLRDCWNSRDEFYQEEKTRFQRPGN